MAFLKNFNHFLSLAFDTLRAAGRGRIWLILLGYAAIVALGLFALYRCFSPLTYPFSKMVVAWASFIGGWSTDLFYEYPSQFLVLPIAHSWFKVVFAIIAEGVILGSAALLFHKHFAGSEGADARTIKSLWSSWGHFILASLSLNALLILLSFAPGALQSILLDNPRRQLIFELIAVPFIYALLQGLFFFVIPSIALFGESFKEALFRSFGIFIRRPLTCFFMALVALLLPTLMSVAANHPDIIIDKFRPELVYWVLLFGILADMIFNFLWIGMAVRFLEDERD